MKLLTCAPAALLTLALLFGCSGDDEVVAPMPDDLGVEQPDDGPAPELPEPADVGPEPVPELPEPQDEGPEPAPELPEPQDEDPEPAPELPEPADEGPEPPPELPEPADEGADVPPPPPSWDYGTTCSLPEDNSYAGTLGVEPAFPALPSLSAPVFLTHAGDGTNRLFLVQQDGRIWVFPNTPSVSKHALFLDIKDAVSCCGERGLLGLAFHPDFGANGAFFVNYTAFVDGKLVTVVSRFSVSADPDQADPESEVVLMVIEQDYYNHNGGMIAFGPDGYLYVGMGDGGSGGDPLGNGQDTTTLLGAMLRIDVDSTSPGLAYGIPPDNPFAAGVGLERPEIYAWGLRNPWRFSFDVADGTLWVADVGQNEIEYVHIVEGGQNYGWNVLEGSECYQSPSCDTTGLVLPVLEYDHGVGVSITGGYVYRGSAMPSLFGAYVYADYATRKVFTYRHGVEAPPSVTSPTPAFVHAYNISSFGQDEAGELYIVSYPSGQLFRLVAKDPVPLPEDFPLTLSATGCFETMSGLEPASGLLPYDVNVPLWSDGAVKERYLVLPDGGQIGWSETGKWGLPVGSLLIKHFFLDTTPGDPSTRVRVETRFIVMREDGLKGYSYRWLDDESDAVLLDGADTRSFTLTPPDADPIPLSWQFPSRSQCRACHTKAVGGVLGLETRQLNRPGALGDDGPDNLIDAIAAVGLFDEAPAPADSLPAFPEPTDGSAPVGAHARAALHVNCAGCHLAGGPTGATLDLTFDTPLAATNTCGVAPEKGTMGLIAPKLVDPGSPENSVLHLRMTSGPPYAMPPLATSLLNLEAAGFVEAWIDALPGCPSP